jgi:hypothetical protein
MTYRRRPTTIERMPSARLAPEPAAWLMDEFIESLVCWREECESVQTAYDRWRTADPRDRRLAFAAYRAALDREERAARVHYEGSERLNGGTGSRWAGWT